MDISSSFRFSGINKKIVPYVSTYPQPAQALQPVHWPTKPFAMPIDLSYVRSASPVAAPNPTASVEVPNTMDLRITPTGQRILKIAAGLHDDYPNMHMQAATFIHNAIKQKLGKDVDPDTLYLDRFANAHSDTKAFSGWAHSQQPTSTMSLTQAVYANYRAYDQANSDVLDAFGAGIYTDPGGADSYDSQNELQILPSQLMKLIWASDFNTRYRTELEAFWVAHTDDYRFLAKSQFIANLLKQKSDGSLDDYEYKLVLRSIDTEVLPVPVTMDVLWTRKTNTVPGVAVRTFDINGKIASDILDFKQDGNPRRVLYIPGGIPAFKAFRSYSALVDWVSSSNPKDSQRQSLASHFALRDRQDGGALASNGVDHILKDLAAKQPQWGLQTINYNHSYGSPKITGDLFSHMASRAKIRDLRDADTRITSNSEINKDIWLSYLQALDSVTIAVAPMFAPINLMLAVGSAARLGLGIQKAVAGDTAAQRTDGVGHALGGVLELSASAGFSTLPGNTAEKAIIEDFAKEPKLIGEVASTSSHSVQTSLLPQVKVDVLERMGWSLSDAQFNKLIAKRVFKEVRAAYQEGLKSGNKVYIDVPKEVLYEGRDVAANKLIKLNREKTASSNGDSPPVITPDSDELKISAGNCGDLSQISAKLVMESGGHAEQWSIEGADHAFTVVGVPPEGPTVDFSHWDGVWIIDPWANIVCRATRYIPRLLRRMEKWQANGKHLSDGLRIIEATDEQWLAELTGNRKVAVKTPTLENPQPWQDYPLFR